MDIKIFDKIRPLTQNNVFPLPENALHAFQNLKVEIENAVVNTIDETIPFEVETDASDFAIAATLNQAGKPVAFFSRSLSETERRHCSRKRSICYCRIYTSLETLFTRTVFQVDNRSMLSCIYVQ